MVLGVGLNQPIDKPSYAESRGPEAAARSLGHLAWIIQSRLAESCSKRQRSGDLELPDCK